MLEICVVGFGGRKILAFRHDMHHAVSVPSVMGYFQRWAHFTRSPSKDRAKPGSLLYAGKQSIPSPIEICYALSLYYVYPDLTTER